MKLIGKAQFHLEDSDIIHHGEKRKKKKEGYEDESFYDTRANLRGKKIIPQKYRQKLKSSTYSSSFNKVW